MRTNVKGMINCIKEEVFEYTCTAKHVNACIPKIVVMNAPEWLIHEDNQDIATLGKGKTLGMYLPELMTVFIFEDSINYFLEKDDTIEETLFIVNTLSHELTHYLQHVNNEPFDNTAPYMERAHEVEARNISKTVTLYYNSVNLCDGKGDKDGDCY